MKKRIVSLKNRAGVSVTSTKEKLEYFRHLGFHVVWILLLMIIGKWR